MKVVVNIPDQIAKRLGSDADRRVLELLALDEFRAGKITEFELQQLLGLQSRFQLDAFLKSRGAVYPYTSEDLEADRQDLNSLGL